MGKTVKKEEVTIEMIAALNKQYRSLYNITVELNKSQERMRLLFENLVVLTEETANLLLIIGSSKGGEATSEFGSETRRQYKKLLTVMEGRINANN
jgi:hypothetical protein|tara:strand:- start:920 stop:1207 length:288 start_codon:yes stop_codon:yes gene_type:complete